jgi:FAD/FMN-containing dehydrogenase
MDRREFLRRSGRLAVAGSVLPLAAACTKGTAVPSASASTAPPPAPPPTTAGPTATASVSPVTDADWAAFGRSLTGKVLRPSTPGYGTAKELFQPRFDALHPQAVVQCASVADVQHAIAFARQHAIPIAPRSGGHSYAGYSSGPGMMIDVSHLSHIAVNPTTGVATIGAGARLIDVYNAMAGAGRALPGGTCPTVGIAGLTLGGGQGVVGRRYGLTCDALTSVRIVNADGHLLHCDAQHNPDLFWASRGGGGGNFGIATSFTFKTSPLTHLVTFTLDWPRSAAARVLRAWQHWGPTAPDALWSDCHLIWGGSSATISVNGTFIGPSSGLMPHLSALSSAVGSAPSHSFVNSLSYLDAMLLEAGCYGKSVASCHLPSQNPAGTLSRESSLAKSDFFNAPLSPAGINAVIAGVNRRGSNPALRGAGGGLLLDAYGGAINRVPASATAFVHRDAAFLGQYFVTLASGASSSVIAENQAWLQSFWRSMRPYASGYAYQNYIDPKLADWQHAYYGSNLQRLVQVKAAYDPHDVFRSAQSIPVSLD